MPPGGEGYYYISTHFVVWGFKYAFIDVQVNGVAVCTAYENNQDDYNGNAGCSAAVPYLSQGMFFLAKHLLHPFLTYYEGIPFNSLIFGH